MSLLAGTVPAVAGLADKHVFISYVREDSDDVDKLCDVLTAADIPYWLDRNDLAPGDEWRRRIREAIRSGTLAFLACFSENSLARERSTMNEELRLAIEEWRLRPPDTNWLIPVRFGPVTAPIFDLGPGQTLGDLNYVDLFGDRYTRNAVSLVKIINRATGTPTDLDATAAAIEQVSDAERPRELRARTKEWVLEPSSRIRLDDMIAAETSRVVDGTVEMTSGVLATGSASATEQQLLEIAQALADLADPLCQSIQVGAVYGQQPDGQPWARALGRLVAAADDSGGGFVALLKLRALPALTALFTASLAAVAEQRFDLLKAFTIDTTVRHDVIGPMSLLEAINPWTPFETNKTFANALAQCVIADKTPEQVAAMGPRDVPTGTRP